MRNWGLSTGLTNLFYFTIKLVWSLSMKNPQEGRPWLSPFLKDPNPEAEEREVEELQQLLINAEMVPWWEDIWVVPGGCGKVL